MSDQSNDAPARITCSCPMCGAMTLPASEFRLTVCKPRSERSFYQFTCPKCSGQVTKQASERVVSGLSHRGVKVSSFPLEALEEMAGPPVSKDDLIDFMLALDDDAGLARNLEALRVGFLPAAD